MADEQHPLELGQDAQFSIQKVYVKDLSFETPHSPEIFKAEWQPGMDMHLTNEGQALGDALYEVVLSITLTVKLDQQAAYLVEVNQAGIFLIDNIPESVIERMLATVCPNILFPFARETVSDVVSRGVHKSSKKSGGGNQPKRRCVGLVSRSQRIGRGPHF